MLITVPKIPLKTIDSVRHNTLAVRPTPVILQAFEHPGEVCAADSAESCRIL
jgi:hypothetical protein